MQGGRAYVAAIGLVLVVAGGLTAPAVAQEPASLEQQLADRHAPIVLLKEQDHACDTDGEPYVPAPVEIVLDDPAVRLRQTLPGDPVAADAPTAQDLAGLDETYYLDYPGNPLRAGCTYEQYARERMRSLSLAPTAHAHIAREEGRDGFAIQYWLFYVFNDFNNKHEGDWEMIQVVFDADTVEEALEADPVEVGYAQHGGGEWAAWDDPKLEKEDGHPVVYVSRGSHASQYDSAVYLGWGESGTGFGCDVTTGPSTRVPLAARLLPADGETTGPNAWITYGGRWGQREAWEFNGPKSPNLSGKWAAPLSWQDDLRPSSLAVPLAGTLGPAPTEAFCDVTAASADLFRLWSDRRWVAVALVALGLAIPTALVLLTRRTLGPAVRLYARNAVVFLPAAGAVVLVGALSSLIGWLVGIVVNAGPLADAAAVSGVVTFVVGILQHIAGLVLIAPAAIYASAELLAGRRPEPAALVEQVRAKLGAVLRALFRPFVVIGLISLVPLGSIPATYATVQRIFIPHAVLLDDASPKAARAISISAVDGHWWRTAALSAIMAALVVIPGPLIGIILLVFAARSVALMNVASSLVYALVYPLIFVATTIYFLDRRAATRAAVIEESAGEQGAS
ncbi:MAG: hypothetical protein ACRDJW_11245 [Thermomicrobiales bacterium]